jgi:molybdenum cofactor synthesis domain-containing protein
MISAAVLTISDSAAAGARADRSGPAVRERLEQLGWKVPLLEVIADSGHVSAIFTTGGTGVAPRDCTPEATRAVLDREIPGIPEVMRARGREATPFASLSRSVAGTRGLVLIVNLPGSPKGAVESLDAIVELAPHVLDLLRGKTEHTATRQE